MLLLLAAAHAAALPQAVGVDPLHGARGREQLAVVHAHLRHGEGFGRGSCEQACAQAFSLPPSSFRPLEPEPNTSESGKEGPARKPRAGGCETGATRKEGALARAGKNQGTPTLPTFETTNCQDCTSMRERLLPASVTRVYTSSSLIH